MVDGNVTNYNSTYTATGGGASDIRIETDSLYARVIVAGGGGGTGEGSEAGGAGGGVNGIHGTAQPSSESTFPGGSQGTQTSGGACNNSSSSTPGTFGQGGKGNGYDGGGGGGGWFGGGGTYGAGAGGGSGFVFTSSTKSYTNSSYTGGTWLLADKYMLTNANTYAGNTTYSTSDGSEKGHSGNGKVKITPVT